MNHFAFSFHYRFVVLCDDNFKGTGTSPLFLDQLFPTNIPPVLTHLGYVLLRCLSLDDFRLREFLRRRTFPLLLLLCCQSEEASFDGSIWRNFNVDKLKKSFSFF